MCFRRKCFQRRDPRRVGLSRERHPRRVRSFILNARCGDERVNAQEVQYLWRCWNCSNEFVTLVASDEEPTSDAEVTKPFFTSLVVEMKIDCTERSGRAYSKAALRFSVCHCG
jgi:hypothetical protein